MFNNSMLAGTCLGAIRLNPSTTGGQQPTLTGLDPETEMFWINTEQVSQTDTGLPLLPATANACSYIFDPASVQKQSSTALTLSATSPPSHAILPCLAHPRCIEHLISLNKDYLCLPSTHTGS